MGKDKRSIFNVYLTVANSLEVVYWDLIVGKEE